MNCIRVFCVWFVIFTSLYFFIDEMQSGPKMGILLPLTMGILASLVFTVWMWIVYRLFDHPRILAKFMAIVIAFLGPGIIILIARWIYHKLNFQFLS